MSLNLFVEVYMKKLGVFEMALISALAALTIVVKMPFAVIPGIEFTTPIFVVLSILLKRNLSVFYVLIFIIADSLLIQSGNIAFIIINAIMWFSIYLICIGVKVVKWQQPIFVFLSGMIAVHVQTLIWLLLLPIFMPKMASPITGTLVLSSLATDVGTGHTILVGGVAVILYFAFIGMEKIYRLNRFFDI